MAHEMYKMIMEFPSSLRRTTIAVLGSFLDTFQKIADAATNTKGEHKISFLKLDAGVDLYDCCIFTNS